MRQLLLMLVCLAFAGISSAQHVSCDLENKKAKKLYDKAREQISYLNLEEAEDLLEAAVEIEPEYAKAWFMLAKIKFRKRQYKSSKEYFQKLLEICPDYEDRVTYELGLSALNLQEWGECETYFTTYLESDKIDPRQAHKADSMLEVCSFYKQIFANPVPFEPKAVQNISTSNSEYLPILTPDNDYMYYIRTQPSKRKTAISGSQTDEVFMMSELIGDTFTLGKALPSPFNAGSNEGGASLTIDNKEMYLTICGGRSDGKGSCDIYYTKRDADGNWQPLRNMNEFNDQINTVYWESQVTVSSDGKRLYFASYRPDGYGGNDIFMLEKDSAGNWSAPKNLGPVINTPGDEKSPFLHVDDQTLYFSSTGHLGLGSFDIFYSRMGANGHWQKPVNIGHPINSPAADLGFFVSTDGHRGYFASNKLDASKGWEIFGFDLYKDARPKKVLFLKGKVDQEIADPEAPVKMAITDMKTKEKKEIPVDSVTGEFVYTQVVENDQMIAVQQKGHMYQTQVVKADDTLPLKTVRMDVKMAQIAPGETFRVDNGMGDKSLLFGTDSYALSDPSKMIMENLVDLLQMNPTLKIAVEGHTDDVGSGSTNMVLSKNRAKAVVDYLVSRGIAASRLQHKGFGESRPIKANMSEAGRAANRRTEIRILR
jgi:outer membrane protein OmpA-like peptidoglycan-associated protein